MGIGKGIETFRKFQMQIHRILKIMGEFKHVGHGTVDLSFINGVAILKLNNHEKRNCISPTMMQQLTTHLNTLHSESENLYGLILTGSGNNYCSGFDLDAASVEYRTIEKGEEMCQLMHHNHLLFQQLPLISISAVEGYAIGGGAELTSWTDFRIMSKSATLRFVQSKMGVSPGWAGGYRVCKIIGYSKALHLFASSQKLTSQNCMDLGYCDRECEPGEALTQSLQWLKEYHENAQGSISVLQGLKKCLQGDISKLQDTLDHEKTIFTRLWGHEANLKALEKFKKKT